MKIEDKALIKNLYLLKGYGAERLMAEFPQKNWKRGLNKLLLNLCNTGRTDRQTGSGRPKSTRSLLMGTFRRSKTWFLANRTNPDSPINSPNFSESGHFLVVGCAYYPPRSRPLVLQEAPCTGTECSKSCSATRPFKETAEKILGQWCRLYVVYGRENIHSIHAQKSPEWSFVRADCVKKERDCTRAPATHTLDDGVLQYVKFGANAADFRRSCSEDQWRILPWSWRASHSTATACCAGDLERFLRLAARQCSSAPRNDTIKILERDARVHCSSLAQTRP